MIGQKYGLETANPVGPDGAYLPGTYPTLDGVNVFKANDIVIELLKEKGALLHVEKMQHSYPCCWRHKTPIIFRATPQWFVSMDKEGLRQQSLKEIKGVQWIPDWGQARIESMVANRPDWCISRQRTWGVPMSLFVHKETQELLPIERTLAAMEEVAKRVEVDGIQAWWDLDPKEILAKMPINTRKFRIRWTFGLIPVPPVTPWLMHVRNSPVMRPICIWKALTSIAAGLCPP